MSWLYKKNNLVSTLNQVLTVNRPIAGSYTDIYGTVQASEISEPREEVEGWLITDDEIHTFNVKDNIPDLTNDFTLVLTIGSYSENAVSQDLIIIPATLNNLLTLGTNSNGYWTTIIQGVDTLDYEASTLITATAGLVIIIYSGGTLNINIDGVLIDSVIIPVATAPMNINSIVNIGANLDANLQDLRFYDFALNTDEIEYLKG